jgi:hypothetical protein
MRIGKQVITQWRVVAEVERVEREKEAFKSKMLSKVSGWLADLDSKTLSETPIPQVNPKLAGLMAPLPSNYRPSLEEDQEAASFRDYSMGAIGTTDKKQPLFTTFTDHKSELAATGEQEHAFMSEFLLPPPQPRVVTAQCGTEQFGTIESNMEDPVQKRIAEQLKCITMFDEMKPSLNNSSRISKVKPKGTAPRYE